jgi:mono/diheme cytochrome c family protein
LHPSRGLCLLAAIGFVVLAWRPALALIVSPAADSFDSGLVRHGAALAAAGNCVTCPTTGGGRSFAGGVPVRIRSAPSSDEAG